MIAMRPGFLPQLKDRSVRVFASDLPNPDSLSVAQAQEVLWALRVEYRPKALQSLKALYQCASDTDETRAETLAEEYRLQELDRYLNGLISFLEKSDPSFLGWEATTPTLAGLQFEKHHRARAQVDLPFSPENPDCVHGPLTVLPIVSLAEKILHLGERLNKLSAVTWAEPIRTRLDLLVCDETAEFPEQWGTPAPVHGSLETSSGRKLVFTSRPLSEYPLHRQVGYNELSQVLLRGQKIRYLERKRSLRITLNPEGIATCLDAAKGSLPMATAILLDLVPLLILTMCQGIPMVDCGFQDMPLPGSLEEVLTTDAELEIRYLPERSHLSRGTGLRISWYEFRYTPFQESFSRTAMAEAKDFQDLLRRIHR
jgi:hypothetical protein